MNAEIITTILAMNTSRPTKDRIVDQTRINVKLGIVPGVVMLGTKAKLVTTPTNMLSTESPTNQMMDCKA